MKLKYVTSWTEKIKCFKTEGTCTQNRLTRQDGDECNKTNDFSKIGQCYRYRTIYFFKLVRRYTLSEAGNLSNYLILAKYFLAR